MDELMELYWEDEEAFEEALEALPISKEIAYELTELTECYDVPQLYRRLLTDYDEVLTAGELKEIRRRYDERFDIPL